MRGEGRERREEKREKERKKKPETRKRNPEEEKEKRKVSCCRQSEVYHCRRLVSINRLVHLHVRTSPAARPTARPTARPRHAPGTPQARPPKASSKTKKQWSGQQVHQHRSKRSVDVHNTVRDGVHCRWEAGHIHPVSSSPSSPSRPLLLHSQAQAQARSLGPPPLDLRLYG